MNDTFLWSEPSKLAVRAHPAPETGHVGGDLFERAADDVHSEKVDRRHAELGSAADRECEAVPGQTGWVVGVQNDISRRVVRIRVHGIGPVQRSGSREPDIARGRPENPRAHLGSELYAKAPMFVNYSCDRTRPAPPLRSITSDLLADRLTCWTIHFE